MHTLVFWAFALALTPLVAGTAWEVVRLLRKAPAPTQPPSPAPSHHPASWTSATQDVA